MRHGRFGRALLLLSLLTASGFAIAQPPRQTGKPPAAADEPDDKNKLEAEEERDRLVAERFRRVLEGNPRRGTALDRLYGYHVERGSLDKLVGEYAERTKKGPKDGIAWIIIGLLESQRGRDAAAVSAFRQSEPLLAGNAMPSYYLGQSLILIGQPDAAAQAFERAIAQKPTRNDLLDIFQALGRVYQRSQQSEKALTVWNRLESIYPDDVRVQEQIASTLVEEGQFAQALPRLQKLADHSDDKYRQTSLRMDVADMKVKLKKTPEALADFEKLLSELNPDNWLYRDVRRRIEEVFLRNDDLAGLAKYYEKWLEKNSTDVDAISRLSKNLSAQGRAPEARAWLTKGVAVAPNNRSLRQALIDQYGFEQNIAAALAQYEAMDKADPNNPDTLREWGKLTLRDTSKSEAERRAAASAIWKRLQDKKPKDAVVASQVADLMRTAGASDDAIALYKKAIELAPDAPQYREYLGEYYHSLKRSQEALETWRPIAEGANRNSKNLSRLAEVFAGFGYRKEATEAMAEAITLEKDDFTMLMTYAELLHQEGRNDDALQQIATASKLTSNPEEVEQVLLTQIKVYQATERLGDRIDELQKELDAGTDLTADRWLRLARYYEANRQADRASEAIGKAIAKDAKSIPVLTAAARIYESSGNVLAAADTNRKLAALDRRYRSEYLTTVAKLEQRLGRREQALQAGRDVLAASPGNPDVYKFFADLCFQLGDQEEGLEALRRSVRANPSEPQGLITLANALAERVRQGEAIELLWRAFEKTNEVDAKLGIIERLTQLYLENNQLDRLLDRLERERRESDKTREATLCLAQAFTTAGDLGTARQQLERLLTENTRDTHLLGQLSSLCEQEGDLGAAVKYQRQLNVAAPNNFDNQLRLAQLLTRSGETDEAAEIWVKVVSKQGEPHRNLQAIDQLLTVNKLDAALAILSRMLLQKPGNWELIYRQGAALMAKQKPEEAAARFKTLLALKLSDDDLGEIAKHQIAEAKKTTNAKSGNAMGQLPASRALPALADRYDEWSHPPLVRRTQKIYEVRRAVGMDQQNYYGGNAQPFYSPSDYGEARIACMGWLYEAARLKEGSDAYAKQLRQAKEKAGADQRPVWDYYYFQVLRYEGKEAFATALGLSKGANPAGNLAYLNSLASRTNGTSNRVRRQQIDNKDLTPPLPADQLIRVLTCFVELKKAKPEWATSQIAQAVMTELKRAGRTKEEAATYEDILKDAVNVAKVQSAMAVAAERKDLAGSLALLAKLEKLQPPAKTTATLAQLPSRMAWRNLLTLMGKLSEDKRYPDLLQVLNVYLSSARKQNLSTVKSASNKMRNQAVGTSVMLYNRRGGRGNNRVNYPTPNDYFDQGMISILYNAFDLYKKADLTSDLLAYLRKQVESARGPERIYALLALGYAHWWAQEKEEAIARLLEAVRSAPEDLGLVLEIAALREQNNEFDEALAMIDAITPLDTFMMQRREETALRLAERTGNIERARQAADRLFGLRLDADKQLELAGKMHHLGMIDAAETVLSRAQRQAGNKTQTLVRLMTQYQSQNQTDLAIQIARQILRKGPSTPNPYNGMGEVDNARDQAVTVLARSGQLKEIIARAEAQLKASPKSQQIYQALVGYYQAAGDKQKLKAAVLKLADLKPDDGKLRYQAAQQLAQMGDRDAAMEQYKIAIKLDANVFSNQYWEIQQLFMQAGKIEELGKLFDELDLRKIGNYWSVLQPISAMLQQDKTKELALKLFKKAWDAYPDQRTSLLSQLYDEQIWRLPEIYNFAKQAIIPRDDIEVDPWTFAESIMSYGQEGRMDATVTRMLALARKQERLRELRTEVEAAVKKKPTWLGGKALLAVLDIQLGDTERGRQEWREVFENPKADPPPISRFVFAQELEFYAGVEDLAIKSLEAGVDEMAKEQDYQFNNNPARRLIWWYKLQGRKDDARKLLDRLANFEMVDPGYYAGNPGYWEYQVAQQKITIAQDMLRSGDPVGAVRIYNQLLAEKEKLEEAAQWGGGDFSQQAEMGMRAALKGLKPELLPAVVEILLTPRAEPAPDQPMLDLVMIVEAQDLKRASVSSLFASAIKATKQTPAVRKEAGAKLATLATQYPTDISVQTASTLLAFVEGRPEDIRRAVDRLVNLVDSTSLEPLAPNGRANARQRAEAALQIPLWLIARECLAKDQEVLWPQGEKLATRAAAAAKRQTNLVFATTIFGEWSRLDLERGDKAKAEADLNELLNLAVPRPSSKADPVPANLVPAPPLPAAPSKVPPSASIRAAAALFLVGMQLQPPAVASPAVPVTNQGARGVARGSVPPLTEEQFRQVYDVALLAAELKLPQLSMRAMREACRGGPPIVETNRRRGGGRYVNRIINGTNYLVTGGNANRITLDQAIVKLVPLWRQQQVSPAEIYDVLAGVVMPAARPSEVFISSPALQFDQVYVQDAFGSWTPVSGIMDESVDDRGLSALLVDTAIEAKKIDDLRAKLDARAKLPLAELNAKIMLAILAMRTKDEAAAKKAIAVLAERIKKDSLLATNTAVGTLLAPLLTDQTYGEIVAPLLEKVAENYATAGNSQPAADTRFKLAAYHLKRKDAEAARKQFKVVAEFGKRVGQGGYDPHLALAQEYLKARWIEDALRELAFHADELSSANNPRLRRQGGTVEPALQPAKFFAMMVQELLDLPTAKRYELLKTWTLPTEGRKNIRYYVDTLPKKAPPTVIVKRAPIPLGEMISTMLLLADAAKEAGKGNELIGIAERMVAEKIENAELFQVLIYLALRNPKDAEPAVRAFAHGMFARLTEKKEPPLRSRYYYGEQEMPLQTRPSEYLFARLCSEQDALQKYAEMLWSPMQRTIGNMFNSDLPSQIQLARNRLEARAAGAPDATKDALPLHWRNGSPRSLWFTQDGYVTQAWSDQTSFLTFDMPLTGTFEFSADVYRGGMGDGLMGYGGVAFGGAGSINQYNGGYGNQPSTVWAVGNSDGVFRNVEGVRSGEFNHFTVQVSPAKNRYLVNGQLLYEDTDPSPTSPWLMLVGQMRGRPVFRNIQLSGKPEVVSEVKLLSGNYLEGWFAPGQLANLPKRLRDKEPERPEAFDEWGNLVPQNQKKEEVYDWQVKNGELLGRRLERDRDRPIPSSLQYFRPMRPGETIRYEFYYEPGKTHVHPALGNLAFLLEPEGAKLHWMADLSTEDWSGLSADNAIDDPKGRRGDKLPFKAGAWNSASITVTATGVKIVLNDVTVYEADLEPSVERVFGFFHYRARSGVRVRQVVLTGAWAKSLPSLKEVAMAAAAPAKPAEAKVRRSLLGENYYAVEASEVLERVRSLAPKERYHALLNWVLPNESRPVFQLGGTTKPLDVLGVVDKKAQPVGKRVSMGGRLDLPALELIASAKEAGTLADLSTRLENLGSKVDDDSFKSSKEALSAVVLGSLGREKDAAEALKSLIPFVDRMPIDAPGHQRWPILVAVHGTAEMPALRKLAGELAEAENKKLDEAIKKDIVFADSDNWSRNFQVARGRLLMATGSETKPGQAEADGPFTYWASTPSFDGPSRSLGFGVPRWRSKDGAIVHYPGHGQDYLALRIPLRGDFEASCTIRLESGREANLVYGLHAFSLNPDAKKYRLHSGLDRSGRETTITPPLPANKTGVYQLRIVMKDGWFRANVDGKEIATEKIGANCDPWLMIYANQLCIGEIRDLRIQGNPAVPSSIDLLTETDLGNWRPYAGAGQRNQNYNGWADNSYPLDQPYYGQPWSKRGEEIFQPGRRPDDPPPGRPAPPRTYPESALFYHRPMLEDGAIEYEFFYVPEKAQVHPILDRLTFLLEPEGVKLHWLTDGVSEKGKVPFDNVLDEPGCRREPSRLALEPKAWNKVRLAVAGDVVRIALNGVEVYERPIEPTNQRTFGLFHYTDRTEARVRRMNYMGAWSKKLPANAQLLELKQ